MHGSLKKLSANARRVLPTATILPTNIFGYRDRYLFDRFLDHIKENKSVRFVTPKIASIHGLITSPLLDVLCAEALGPISSTNTSIFIVIVPNYSPFLVGLPQGACGSERDLLLLYLTTLQITFSATMASP